MRKEYTIVLEDNIEERDDKLVIRPYQQDDIGNHNHNFFELAYITGGSAKHILNDGTEVEVHCGDYFIIDYGTVHRYSGSKDFTLINCLFLPEVINETLAGSRSFDEILRVCLMRYYKQYPGPTPVNRIFHDEDGKILQMLCVMGEEYEKKQIGYKEVFQCRLLEILILTMRKVISEDKIYSQVASYSQPVLKAMQHLGSNYRDKAVLGDFCEKYHYSPQYISRRFKQETGFTAQEYLQKIRIEKSCELLVGGDMQIQEIAHEVGYEDVKFFQQLFKRFLKMSPRDYRKMEMRVK